MVGCPRTRTVIWRCTFSVWYSSRHIRCCPSDSTWAKLQFCSTVFFLPRNVNKPSIPMFCHALELVRCNVSSPEHLVVAYDYNLLWILHLDMFSSKGARVLGYLKRCRNVGTLLYVKPILAPWLCFIVGNFPHYRSSQLPVLEVPALEISWPSKDNVANVVLHNEAWPPALKSRFRYLTVKTFLNLRSYLALADNVCLTWSLFKASAAESLTLSSCLRVLWPRR